MENLNKIFCTVRAMLSKCKKWMRTYLYQFYYDYDYKSQNVDRVKIIVLYITLFNFRR
jgi:hypothetical protein